MAGETGRELSKHQHRTHFVKKKELDWRAWWEAIVPNMANANVYNPHQGTRYCNKKKQFKKL